MSTNNVNIVNTNNWYQKMNLNGTQNIGNMVLSGTNPSTQLALISVANDVHYCYSNYALQKTNGFTLSFQFYITGTDMNSICAYFGVTDPTTGFDANGGLANQSGAVELMIRPAGVSGGQNRFNLYTNYGSNTIAATNGTSVTTGTWQTVTITFTPSATGTWVVNYNGTNVISYNDTSFTSFTGNQNTVWGIHGATGGSSGASIRAVDLSVKQSMPLSVLKNTYSFYPEECFINKLSTHSQTNAAAAFGLRLLRADYLGPVINVRRGSDNATLDFYADSRGNVGTTLYGTGTTLLTWLAGSIGYLTRWYDQTGNGRDVIQATTSAQPKIGTPILDSLSSSGKSAAKGIYALYRANSTYTGATIKLRRSSDNAVSDFYADVYGNLTDATGNSFSSWISISTAYVDTWYDQSGSGNHATQSTTNLQPVYNGTLKLLDFSNSSFLNMGTASAGPIPTGTLNAPYTFVTRHGAPGSIPSGGGIVVAGGNTASSQLNGIGFFPNYGNYWYGNDLHNIGTPVSGNTFVAKYDGTNRTCYINNNMAITAAGSGYTASSGYQQYIGKDARGAETQFTGQLYTLYIFNTSLSDSDRMACTSNPTDLNIKYDGSQCLNQGTTNWPLTNGLKNYTYIFSGRIDGNNNDQSIIQMGLWNANNTGSALYLRSNSYGFAGYGNDALDIVAYTPFVNRKCVMMCNHNLNTGNVVINDNGTIYTGTTGSPSALNLTNTYFTIGAVINNASIASFTGNINEVIVFRNTLTAKESQIYFTPNAISRKNYRSQPVLQIKDTPKDIGTILPYPVIALDTQMLSLSPGSLVTSWNGFTGYNSPVINAGTYNNGTIFNIPPYVSLTNNNVSASLSTGKYFDAGSKTFNINTNGGFTAIWCGAFTGSANDHERIFDFGSGTSNNILATRQSTTTNMYFLLNNGGTSYSINCPNIIVQNEWAVWTFRYTASSRYMEIIKNGILYATGTAGAAITDRTLTNTWIGRSNWTSDAYSSINMSGLYVYANFISDANVASISNHLMNCTTSTMPSVLPDYNNKVVRYGHILSQGFRNGQAMYFSGKDTTSYLDIQDVPNYPLTFCFWFNQVNVYGATNISPAALCSADLAGGGIQFDMDSSGTRIVAAYHNGSNYTQFTNSTVALNTWYHVAFVVTPTTAAYYLNGSLVQSVSVVIPNTNRIIIGKSGDNARPYNGYIADIRVFDYALRADEINSIYNYNGQAGQEIMNYNTPTNYLVNMSNWYTTLNTYQTGSFGIASDLTGADFYYRLTGNGVANSSNTLFNSTKIQNYNSFTCSFLVYIETTVDHGYYFYCGATSSTTVPSGTAGTAANSSYYVYFQITGTKGIYLYNNQGQQLAYSPVSAQLLANSVYVPVTIVYNRSTTNTWTVNVASNDILTYSDPNNANWVSNIAGDIWGIGARTTTSGMSMYIRRVELSYTPFVNTINTTVNAQNNTKFPPGAMTAASTTFTGTSILDGVYTATASNSNGAGINPYSAFDNNTSTYWGELDSYNSSGVYTGGISTAVTNLVTNTTTSYTGEWLQIQVPNAVTLNSFSLMGRQDQSLFLWRTPATFYIAGSNDNVTWQLIHSTSGAQFTSAMQYFTCNANNTNKYRYFRIITSRISNVDANGPGGPTIDIAAWDLYTQMNLVNAAVIAVPPYSMTSNTTTFSGNSIYDGTYTLTSSNTNYNGGTIGDPYVAFNDTYGSFGNVWSAGYYYNTSTGAYIGSVSTTVSGVTQSVEWIQIQLPNPIVLYSFSLNFWWPDSNYRMKSFLIAGSNDGSTWTNIYDNTNASFVYGTAQTFVVTGSSVAYRYFRLIGRSTAGGGDSDWWILDQWKLYTNQSNFNLTKFPPAPLTADTPVTFNTVNQKNWYNIMSYGYYSGSFNPVLSGSDPLKQLQLTNSTNSVRSYCNVTGQPVMNYNSFTFSFQLYCANTGSGDYLLLYFGGGGGYQVTFAFEIYYYQGIRLSTSSVGNAVVSATNWFNSAWNDVRVVYNRSGTNTWTLFFNETQVIQYSDPNWGMVPGGTWGFDTFNGGNVFTSYIRQLEMTIAPVSIPGTSIVSGNYTASASSYYDNNNLPCYAFGNNIWNASNYGMWHSATGAYSNGAYTGGYTTTVSGTSYAGEWLQLQAPNPLQLASFSIYPRQDGSLFQRRSPRNFVIAGSNNASTWNLLHTATGISDWTAAEKYFVCNGSNVANKYSYFRLIVMSVGNPNPGTGDFVNIVNLNLYTPISLNNSITPATPKGLLDGLTWKYYDGASGYSVSYYTTNTYRNIGRSTNTTNINTLTNGIYPVSNGDYYSVEIFGYFRATVSGTYTFSISSDDGTYIWIGPNALVGYTTSNANMNNAGNNALISCTVTLLAGTYYPIRIHYVEVAGGDDLTFSFTPPGGTQTYNGQGYFFSGTGLDSAFPQESAKIIKDLTSTNKDGVYYILVNGISTPIHCLMNDCYDGGGWMMLMKGTTGSTFQYSSNYWTSKNTLNASDLTRNDADAKYDTFNYSTVKDVLAIWPDIPSTSYTNPYGQNGGSIFVSDGWTWLLNNWNETSRITPLTGFSTTRLPHQNTSSVFQTYGINNPFRYNGFGGWCSRQTGAYSHGFSGTGNANVRWGFLFNNESNELNTCDVFCGIGMGALANYSAGDYNNGGAWAPVGINRTARFEMYGR